MIEKSVQALESAILQGTGDLRTEARYHLGRILYENRKNLPRAVDELRQVAQLEPGSVRTPFYLGQAIRAMVEIDLLTGSGGRPALLCRGGRTLRESKGGAGFSG